VLAPTPCSVGGCRELVVAKGKCREHQTPWEGSTRRARLPQDWSTRRLIVLKRDKGICHICGKSGADTVDHVVAGDDHSLQNLKPVHDRTPPHCHRYKTNREAQAVRDGNRVRRRR